MATGTEGIALLSMYNDEEDEEEEEEEEEHQEQQHHHQQEEDNNHNIGAPIEQESNEIPNDSITNSLPGSSPDKTPQYFSSPSPQNPSEIRAPRSPTPPPLPKTQIFSSPLLNLTSPSPPPPIATAPAPEAVDDARWVRRGALAIVDYAHDEAAMSPEAEEGEIVSSGFAMEIETFEGNFEEKTTPGTVQLLTPSTQPEPQPSELPEQSKSETSIAIDSRGTEPKVAQAEVSVVVSEEVQKDDPLNSFLPPPLTTKCPKELQEKMNKFLEYKRAGKSFNADLRNRKDYKNPDFLQHAVRYQDIDQIGTCFSKDVFDPHGYDKSDYYDEIEAGMKHEMERKEQERKKGPKVEFVAGGTQPGTVAPALKISTQIPVGGISAAVTSGLQSVSTAVDATKEIRQNKKTKWDKIDGDVKNPLHSGAHDALSAVGVHAAHLSAANAGTGYTAFAQLKRREAEERRSGERKFDKRS